MCLMMKGSLIRPADTTQISSISFLVFQDLIHYIIEFGTECATERCGTSQRTLFPHQLLSMKSKKRASDNIEAYGRKHML